MPLFANETERGIFAPIPEHPALEEKQAPAEFMLSRPVGMTVNERVAIVFQHERFDRLQIDIHDLDGLTLLLPLASFSQSGNGFLALEKRL